METEDKSSELDSESDPNFIQQNELQPLFVNQTQRLGYPNLPIGKAKSVFIIKIKAMKSMRTGCKCNFLLKKT